ncbi:hypothetical protein HK097_007237 [Rhizophlyctis rosea]|uniref:Capsid protein n=1 Tax=Rhizophlyctis rosea TaxID=64517 RepID=A0AAD5X1R4_9FUNG|nr:hypothetical protein HK097_007237 [Rhizophlyctis rosea]
MTSVVSYRFPPINPAVKANSDRYNSTTALNGSVFRSDQNQSILFNFADTTQFLSTVQSYLTGTITCKDAQNNTIAANAGSTGVVNTFQGISRCFSRVEIKLGGVVIETSSSYSDLLAMYYSSLPKTKKDMLKYTEGFSDPNWFGVSASRKFAHLLMSSLWVTPQCLPLPLIKSGGLTVELYLAPASDVFPSSNVDHYKVSSPSFKWLGVTPSMDYIIGLQNSVFQQGRSAYIPFKKIHFFPSNGNGSNSQQIVLPIGQVSSISSIETVFYDDNSMSNRSIDKYSRFTNANLETVRFEGAGFGLPNQMSFKFEGGKDPELALLGLISATGNAYTMDEYSVVPTDNSLFRIAIAYENSQELFGTGLNTIGSASPFLTIYTTHTSAVPTSTRIMTYVTTDALIQFRGEDIIYSEIF